MLFRSWQLPRSTSFFSHPLAQPADWISPAPSQGSRPLPPSPCRFTPIRARVLASCPKLFFRPARAALTSSNLPVHARPSHLPTARKLASCPKHIFSARTRRAYKLKLDSSRSRHFQPLPAARTCQFTFLFFGWPTRERASPPAQSDEFTPI